MFLRSAAVKWCGVMYMRGKAWLLAFVMGILLPGVLFSIAERAAPRTQPQSTEGSSEETTDGVPNQTEQAHSGTAVTIAVLQADGTVSQMNMDAYLVGVVLGEMPANFETEALRAQAVVSRTYALKRNTTGQKHKEGAVCTNSACCQAYRSIADYLSGGGSQEAVDKVSSAVKSTGMQVLTYNGGLIEATYFSCSGGRTEDAKAVWGTDIPYLQAVDSPGEEEADYHTDTVEFTGIEFAARLGISPNGTPSSWLGAVTYTDGGGVDTMVIGGRTFNGTALRQKLGLRSTAFEMTAIGNTICVTTRGFGHRVGMSQYGADAMAVGGNSYREILAYYYPGTKLEVYS